MSDKWLLGESARVFLTVATPEGVLTDPAAVAVKVKAPDGTLTAITYGQSGEIVRTAAGLFYYDLPLAQAGTWSWRWETTAPAAGAVEGLIYVEKSRVL